jgi:23S rRNA U2552 (ribose-2'-O)-methylase RlmE/FtsJ
MKSLGVCFTLEPIDPILINYYTKKNITYSDKELINEKNILNSSYADSSIIQELFKAKQFLHNNYQAYKYNRNKIIPRSHIFEGKHYKYHTFIKLMQCFLLCNIDMKKIKTFYDICGAPGEWIRSLFKECPIEKAYAISLYDKGIPYDKEIYNYKNLRIISPNDGNIYKLENLKESLTYAEKVDLVCCDGGFSVRELNLNESLQALALIHLIFAEFIYGLCFTKEKTGIFICKVFDLLDDITVQILMCATIFYKKINIVKPNESRAVNGEKYLVCQELEFNDDKYMLRNKLLNLLVECQNSNPGDIFEKYALKNYLIKNFKDSLINLNNYLIKAQSEAINSVVNLCIEKFIKRK